MHEMALLADLLKQVEKIARKEGAKRVTKLHIQLGALSHISPEHLREHFDHESKGTVAEGATLEISQEEDIHDPNAQEIILKSLDVDD
jgi:hydrogenase nickel incorporation protein HypA/HybF